MFCATLVHTLAENTTIFMMRVTFGDEFVLSAFEGLSEEEKKELAKRHSHQVAGMVQDDE